MRYIIKDSVNKEFLYSGNVFFEYTKDIFKAKNFQTEKTAQKWVDEINKSRKLHGDCTVRELKVVGITINEIKL